MAAPTPNDPGRLDDGRDRSTLQANSSPTDGPAQPLRALAFWSAVLLPLVHVPLVSGGLATPGERTAFLVLLALNAIALYAGHAYGAAPDADADPR